MLQEYKDGYGVVDMDGLDVRSVSPTRRAAIINWLVPHGTMVMNSFSDDQIEAIWEAKRGEAEVLPVRVYVSRVI